jgi:hypothetical protein
MCEPQHPSSGRNTKSYSDIVAGRKNDRKFKITIRPKGNHPPETMKEIIKNNINPTEMKVGINTFKVLKDGRILIEAGSKEEIEGISTKITEKCGKELEPTVQELRNPRLVIYNIPDDKHTRKCNKDNTRTKLGTTVGRAGHYS